MKPIYGLLVLCLLLLAGLSGCTSGTPQEITQTSLPETMAPTIMDTLQPSPELTVEEVSTPTEEKTTVTSQSLEIHVMEGTPLASIVLTQPPAEDTPTPEPTVQEKFFPEALIQMLEPASNSQLASPIKVMASVVPGAGNLVSVQLFGEDGRIISDQLMKMVKTESGWVNLSKEIEFEISTAGESALLVISTHDEYGRRIAQAASEVFLIQIGESDVLENEFFKSPFVVQSPKAEAVIKGGTVTVTGYAHPYNTNPIIIELLSESGGVMETAVVKLPRNPDNLNYLLFTTAIPYDVGISTPVRMIIRQRSLILPNIDVSLSSQLITLEP